MSDLYRVYEGIEFRCVFLALANAMAAPRGVGGVDLVLGLVVESMGSGRDEV